MKKACGYGLSILFFGTLWGASEAIFGGALYHWGVPRASVLLAVVALAILSVARVYLPRPGSATLIASCAVLYKILNTSYMCHLLAIFLLGAAYDIASGILKPRRSALRASLVGAVASYLGYGLFALAITYVFRYHYWVEAGWPRIVDYVGISGTLAAAANAMVVPAASRLAEARKDRMARAFELTSAPGGAGVCVATAVLWIVCMTVSI